MPLTYLGKKDVIIGGRAMYPNKQIGSINRGIIKEILNAAFRSILGSLCCPYRKLIRE
jgi:hypothetical protein